MNKHSTVTLRTGREIPIIGLGTWQLNRDTSDIISSALGLGYPMIDTSGDYGTQPGIGDGILLSGFEREAFYLVSKVEETDNAYNATEQNLKQLQLSYSNLMLIHRPPKHGVGEKLWHDLIRAKKNDLTRDIGVSNYSVDQLQRLIDKTGEVPVVNQIEWSPFGHSLEMLGYCQENDIIIQAYSPLTRGTRLSDPLLVKIAGDHHKTASQVLVRWNLEHGVVPIIKANNPAHLRENIDVFDFSLNHDEIAALDSLNEEYSALGSGKLAYVRHYSF